MSVSNQTNKTYGSGNGVTTTFSYPFKVFDVSQLYAYLTDASGNVTGPLVYNTDFTASINPVTDGGMVTFIIAPPTGTTWFLKRIVPYTQTAVIPSEGVFPGKQFENQLDLVTMMVIQANETVTRCLQLPTTYVGSLPITIPSGFANAAIGWDPTGTFLTNLQVTAIGPISVPIANNNLVTLTAAGLVSGTALTGLASIPSGAGVIPQANLPTITVAGKVSGAALTSLSSIPSGAGLIPVANVGALVGSPVSKSVTTVYQAATDLWVYGIGQTNSAQGSMLFNSDSSATPSTLIDIVSVQSNSSTSVAVKGLIQKGNYYEIILAGSMTLSSMFATPIGS